MMQLLLALRTPHNSWQHGSSKSHQVGPQSHQVAVVLPRQVQFAVDCSLLARCRAALVVC